MMRSPLEIDSDTLSASSRREDEYTDDVDETTDADDVVDEVGEDEEVDA